MDANLKHMQLEFDEETAPRPTSVALKGRYHWALVFGLIGAAMGGVVAYETWIPMYTGTAMIQVAPILPRIMFKSEENSLMPMYDSYISSQMELVQSPKVLASAMRQLSWQERQGEASMRSFEEDDGFDEFRSSVSVNRKRGSQIIFVLFRDEDPEMAVAGVNAVLTSYRHVYGRREDQQREERLERLEARQRSEEGTIKRLQIEMQQISAEVDSHNLELVYQIKLTDQQRLNARLEEIGFQVAGFRAVVALTEGRSQNPSTQASGESESQGTAQLRSSSALPTGDQQLTEDVRNAIDVAADRAELESLRQHKKILTGRLAEWTTFAKEEDPNVRTLIKQLVHIDSRLDPLEDQYANSDNAASQAGYQDIDPLASAEEQLVMLEAQERVIKDQLKKSNEKIARLSHKLHAFELLKIELGDYRARLKETARRLDELHTESTMRGRITFVNEGTVGSKPSNRRDLKQRSVLGAMGGLTIGAGIVVLFGLINPKCRFVEDVKRSIGEVPLIGIVPQLPHRLTNEEHVNAAARSVQQIRMQLQLLPQPCRVLAVTSPAPGDGKTSLTTALGMSYAATGCRTLLIDLDLSRCGLTKQAECLAHPRIGPVMLREDMLTVDQLANGLEHAMAKRIRLGEALVDLGTLSEKQVEHALALQSRASIGLREVLRGESLESNVHSTHAPNLDILPLCGDGAELIGHLSPSCLASLLEQARREYATIIMDTGPVPSSPEAPLVAMQSDGVLLIVGKGVRQRATGQAVDFLRQIHANIFGAVFNRAAANDMKNSGLGSGSRPARTAPRLPYASRDSKLRHALTASRFGAVAHATALCLPAHDVGLGAVEDATADASG